MLQSLTERISAVEQRAAVFRAPRLRNVVAEILLHFSGQKSYETTTSSDDFAELASAGHDGLVELARGMGLTGLTVADVATAGDDVLARRDQRTSPGSLEALDAEVAEVRGVMTPELERYCPDECRFLAAYEMMKELCPDRFTP
ncbi:hypothetical protein GPECTOR_44g61 [Gonium pectorale]|uniref:Uncharacterized protein n=1 Tax=Gonium pectorale TaxID=33097 RepID=A0A150G954_GONPE|nr:hypothetical protein GPECTOR_44g61 [Gonium pectorale]|eukprot:KXZ46386.1 hypothetical protein GPECTOR_44g61 [Gonium pectorale]